MTSTLNPDSFASEDLTRDAFLGGRLHLWQPRHGYRAGVDPVFLAAAVPAKPGESVLDLGCGVGAAALCLATRTPDLTITGIEIQPTYAQLMAHNAQENGLAVQVVTGDLADPSPDLRQMSFDHVITNPPYYQRERGTAAPESGREAAMGEVTPFDTWIDAAMRRLRPGGRLTLIQHIERLDDVLAALRKKGGDTHIYPLAPRVGRDATRFLCCTKKGAKGPLRLAAPQILHEGDTHSADGDSYTQIATNVLRHGQSWPWIAD
ncbi:MAG: methyltransferase [Pseudomonadota bacterium]